MSDPQTFTLSRPLKTHSGEITKLTLREPTAGAFIDYGEPFSLKTRFDKEGEPDGFEFVFDNNKALTRFMVDMIEEKTDDLVLKGLTASDFRSLRQLAATIIVLGVPTVSGEPDKSFTASSEG
jgi:hypothetical protein